MNRAALIALAGLLVVVGCSRASSPAQRQEKREGMESARKQAEDPEARPQLAKHRVMKKETCQIASQTARCYGVSTDAKSREDLSALTQHFRNQSSGIDAVEVTFFVDKPYPNSAEGYAFYDREAAQNILSKTLSKGVNSNEEVNKAMHNDGIYVLTVEDKLEQQACEGWEPRSLGPPPERWECPGF
jgi:hypothetical protein